ncbi:RNA polymerase sigma factor [Nocardia stercoris]|uniref:Sigma-70 family RNA polymerase sigma factor n=1 Tax=Nocardia stercoris TaxID=2483361 RepID=A0A3M2L8G1_9NOCA|nr:sigma-70 family RNA polymerase sigma factor [Nocardia stercoris]RMI32803.1 sigma-70 family RNA polymerase sigma factor [Nocardia stercoris]
MSTTAIPTEIDCLLRELAPQVVGILARRSGDFDAAEDAVQEALLAAALQWPESGLPDNPRAWLVHVAQRRLTDAIRSEISRRARESTVADPEPAPPADAETDSHDDTLALFFLCCHPALPPASAIALTLRAVGGLTTGDIARAFLVPESTMAQRISRAKKQLSGFDRPFAPPPDSVDGNQHEATDSAAALNDSTPDWETRLAPVLRVLYLMFTEGHTSSAGTQLDRADLAAEAIRLTRLVHRLLPTDPEVTALLAIMLLTDARRPARTGPNGELIPLAEQDRTRWDRRRILEGIRHATGAIGHGLTGPYRIQAAIAAVHAQARQAEDTDWERILALYDRLAELTPNPMVTLNQAVAAAMVHGPAAGLARTEPLEAALSGHHRLHAVRGHLHEMAGDRAAAVDCYLAAARATTSTPEHDYLTLRAALLRTTPPDEETP